MKLTAEFTSPLQLIIGTNGCGKTRLLNEISVLPAARANYEADGGKTLVVEHNGHTYTLGAEFHNKTKPHSFICDGISLNESGTTTVQNELIEQHFGYTQQLHDIATNALKISKLLPSQRKQLLMDINPCQLEFMNDTYKRVCTKVRAIKTTIAHLNARKESLTNSMLSDDEYRHHQNTLIQLNTKLTALVEQGSRIDEIIRRSRQDLLTNVDVTTLDDITQYLRTCMPTLGYAPIDIGMQSDIRDKHAQLRGVLSSIETQIHECTQTIDRYTQLIDDYDQRTASYSQIQADIVRIDAELAQFDDTISDDEPVGKVFLDQERDAFLQTLNDHLSPFLDCTITLLAGSRLTMKRKHVQYHTRVVAHLDARRNDLQQRLSELDAEHRDVHDSVDQKHVVCEACILYQKYTQRHTAYQEQHRKLTESLASIEHKHTRVARYLRYQSDQLSQLEIYTPHLSAFYRFMQRYPMIFQKLSGEDYITTLSRRPYMIYHRLDAWFKQSERIHRHRELLHEKETLAQQLAAIAAQQTSETEIYTTLVDNVRTQLDDLRQRHDYVVVQLNALDRQIDRLRVWEEIQDRLARYKVQINNMLTRETTKHDIDVLTLLKARIDEERTMMIDEISTVGQILKKQDALKARYSEEVIDQIDDLTKQQNDYEEIEKALSPHDGLLYVYTVDFFNNIVTIVNHHIRMIFNYPIVLENYADIDSIDYRFRVTINNEVPLPDISECSEAQKEVIDIAFNVALMQVLNKTNYPVYFDEVGRTFDRYHKQSLLTWFKYLIDSQIVSQVFLINHNTEMSDGFADAETLVLNPDNIMVPEVYNQHVIFELRHE